MQAITIAIGKTGIDFFAQHYLVDKLLTLVKKLSAPDKTFSIPDFKISSPTFSDEYSNIRINLQTGTLVNFAPAFQSVAQGNAYTSQKSLEAFLTTATVPASYFAVISLQEGYVSILANVQYN